MATRRVPGKTSCYIALALVLAQTDATDAQGVVHVRPLVEVAHVYDSNLFFTPAGAQADFVTRLTAGLESGYRSELMTLAWRYARDLEHYGDHPDLTSMNSREDATVESTYRPTRRLTLAAGAGWSTTHTPGDLNAGTGLTFTRAAARRLTVRSSVRRQFGRITAGRMDYAFTGDHLAGGVGIRNHIAGLGTEHHLSLRDTVTVGYRVNQFLFGTDGVRVASATSHAFTAGWTRAVTRQVSLSMSGGPQLTNGSPAAEVSASVRYRIRSADLSLAYGRGQTTILGWAGTASTQSVTGSAAWTLQHPSLHVQLSPAFFQSAHPQLRAGVYRLGVDADHRIADGLSAGVALALNVQHNRDAMLTRDTIARHTLMIRLVAAPAARH